MSGAAKALKKVVSKVDPFTAKVTDGLLGSAGLPNITGNDGGKADEARRMAEEQARVQLEAANLQANATTQAAQAQSSVIRDQAAAATAAQVAAINQNALAAQLASQAQAAPQENLSPDVQLNLGDSSDPRRKYRGASQASIGGTAGGAPIRL
ncbi:hypothetical protein LMG3458_02489 [Achromobacter deleyi]|uniref:Uncharacterized protein n=1 Tax=Achromobacter deleyi TaxID=1353891 RepID=A0A6S7A232_9BURK|nr:hypothetical protein [Achromobacter deleyi]CAB3697903.1 hypothetical protein LMG3458_02489 [Achromobacter deleyi]